MEFGEKPDKDRKRDMKRKKDEEFVFKILGTFEFLEHSRRVISRNYSVIKESSIRQDQSGEGYFQFITVDFLEVFYEQ